MRKVNLEEYQSLVKKAKSEKNATATNCFLFPDALQRWSDLGRLFVEEVEAGLFFLTDEGRYYSAYYYLNPEESFQMPVQDKPVAVQNIYKASGKPEKLVQTDKHLLQAGFRRDGRMVHYIVNPEEALKKISTADQFARKQLAAAGYQVGLLTEDQIPEMYKLIYGSDEVRFYQIPWYSDEELRIQIREGYLFGILSPEGRLCATRYCFLVGNTIRGVVAVVEQYKNMSGMAVVCMAHQMRLAADKKYKLTGWIEETNEASMKFHLRMGYSETDRRMDEWIMGDAV